MAVVGESKENQISGSNVNRRESDALSEYDGSIDFILSLDAKMPALSSIPFIGLRRKQYNLKSANMPASILLN